MTAPGTLRLTDRVVAEIRAELGRQHLNGLELAQRLGVERNWIYYRLNGDTPLRVDDLERIATALDVPVSQLLPAEAGAQ